MGIIVAVLLPVRPVQAAVVTVNSLLDTTNNADGVCTIREAIINANNDAATWTNCAAGTGADVISFSVAGTITLTSSLPNITDVDGLTVDGGGAVTISGNNAFRIITVNAGVPVTFQNITLTAGNGSNGDGGAIDNNGGTITLTNATFSSNVTTGAADDGGAIYNRNNGTLIITDSTFTANRASTAGDSDGGAIYSIGGTASVSITNSLFDGNISSDDGGAIFINSGTLTVANTQFLNHNNAVIDNGGALYINGGTSTITNSTFTNNRAQSAGDDGGAIYVTGAATSVTISGSTFSGNIADDDGGAINQVAGTLTVMNSTFTGNYTLDNGGAIHIAGGTVNISGSSFTNNNNVAIDDGGAIYLNAGTLTISGTTFTGNRANEEGGAIFKNGGTLAINNNSVFDGNISVNNGGGVYAVNAGNTTITNSTFQNHTDANINSGAGLYFANGTLNVTGATFSGNRAQSAGDQGGGIYIASGTATIDGTTFANNIADTYGGAVRVAGGTITITNSTFTGNTATANNGGAVYMATGTVGISGSTFTNNAAGTDGGAVAVASGTLTLTNDSFNTNRADDGGAVYSNAATLLTITVSSFTGNIANGEADGDGGAITMNSATAGSSLTISGSTFSGNTANDDGGAIWNNAEPVTITTTTFSGNQARSGNGAAEGGAIYNSANADATSIRLSTFTNNTVAATANVNAYGGAIANYGAAFILANDTFAGNAITKSTAGAGNSRGGALWSNDASTIHNVTFSSNNVSESGTGTADGGSVYRNAGAVTIANTILANSTENGAAGNCGGTITNGGNNIHFNGADCGAGFTNADPNLGALTGSPAYIPFNTGSPAAGTGSNAICATATTTNNQSQNGVTRPQPAAGICDIGSFELQNQPPTDIALSNTTINENQLSGTTVGTLTSTDVDDTVFTYSLVDTVACPGPDNASFQIGGASNDELQNAAVFNFEAVNSHTVCVRTTDGGGNTFDKQFTITVNDLNEAPTDIALSNNTIDENQPADTVIGSLSATDPDAIASFTFSLACAIPGADDLSFNINGTDLRSSISFDFETQSVLNICVRVEDQFGLTFDENFVINVNDLNENPTDIVLSNITIIENQPANSVVGSLSASDPDAGAAFTFSLTCVTPGADDLSFNINGTDLRSSISFDFETQTVFNICVRVTDQGGLTFDENFTINVNDVDDTAPSVTVEQAGTADPTNASPINFTVTFSEPIDLTTFTDADITLSGTAGATTVSITEIAPNNGTTFNVAVSGMTGSGTVIILLGPNVLTDLAGNGNNASTSADNIVTFDVTYPVVLFGANTVPANGANLTTGPVQIKVEFSKDIKNDGSAGAANTIVNYLLVEDGANNAFETASCAPPGPVATDTQIAINTASYTNAGGSGPFVATLNINGGAALPDGSYRLFVCGTTSIEDLIGNKLNDGLTDTTIDFTVQRERSGRNNGNGATQTLLGLLPATGFPQGQVTVLQAQPAEMAYASYSDLWLEIPKLGLKMPIVGVPRTSEGWNVSWLNRDAGWLNGSAFPTWTGNSVITAHVWDALNQPGPFAELKGLRYGDQIKVHAFGQVYTYEIRENAAISPTSISTVFKPETKSWITLVTCEDYTERSQTYSYRRMVRAVLVSVTNE